MLSLRYRHASGYTLVELLVVLSIILAILGLLVPRAVTTLSSLEFRKGAALTLGFLRQSHLDSIVNGETLRVELEDRALVRSDGKRLLLPKGLQFSSPSESSGVPLAIFYPSGRNNSGNFFISDSHNRKAEISIDPLSSIPKCQYY